LLTGKDFMTGLRELDDDTLSCVASILARREQSAHKAGNSLEAACHGLGALLAQRALTERSLGIHPEIAEMLNRNDDHE
jgi:hypothetical protein